MDFNKSKVSERVAEQLTNSSFHAIDRLIGHRTKVKDAVVQSRVEIHLRQLLENSEKFTRNLNETARNYSVKPKIGLRQSMLT